MIEVHEQHVNPLFDYDSAVYDQMLIKLAHPPKKRDWPLVTVNFDPTIPTIFQQPQQSRAATQVTLIGVGHTDRNSHLPTVLQSLTVNYLPNPVCKSLPGMWQVKEDMICVIGGDENTSYTDQSQCNGDSGGPYLLLGNTYEEDLLIGTVSW